MKLEPKYVILAKPGCFPQIRIEGSVRWTVQYHSQKLFRDIAWRIKDIVWHGLFGHIRHLRFRRAAMVIMSRFMTWRFRDARCVHRVRWESSEKDIYTEAPPILMAEPYAIAKLPKSENDETEIDEAQMDQTSG